MSAVRKIIDRFIVWAVRRALRHSGQATRVVTFGGDLLFKRYEFLWPAELPDALWEDVRDEYPNRPGELPWWRPFNAFLHCWCPAPELRESVHDHPRWSITICLRGRIIERTPWRERLLKPGSIVFRSHKAIHSFEVPAGYRGKTWTLFIVGRRKHRQNTYVVTAQ